MSDEIDEELPKYERRFKRRPENEGEIFRELEKYPRANEQREHIEQSRSPASPERDNRWKSARKTVLASKQNAPTPNTATPDKKSFVASASDKLRNARDKLRDYNDKAYNGRMERRNKQIKELEQKTKIARLQSQTATYQRKANPPAYRPSTGIRSGIDLSSGFGSSFGGGMGGSGISFGGRGGGIDLGPMFGGGPALEPKKKHKKQNKKSKNNGQNIHIHIDRR